ncbi:MAG: hypothetical protein OXE53_13030 [Deltaproteobacteria bacterium]|nr:hypothetical protein [Deltaproteobacteria bacterium]
MAQPRKIEGESFTLELIDNGDGYSDHAVLEVDGRRFKISVVFDEYEYWEDMAIEEEAPK